MGFMSSLVSIGSVTLQSAINSFGQDIILAHTTARRIIRAFHDDVRCAGNYDGNLLWTESWSRKV